jgi:hypothetical protein
MFIALHKMLIALGTVSVLLETRQQRQAAVDIPVIYNIHQLCFVSNLNGLYAGDDGGGGVVVVVLVLMVVVVVVDGGG